MKSTTRIALLGVGLIGSSISLCIKKKYSEIRIIGWSDSLEELNGAKQAKVIDDYTLSLCEAVKNADIIFLCTPISVTLRLMNQLQQLKLKKNILITDVSSTKSQICREAQVIFSDNITFVGGHPMAGSHKTGFIAADSQLFENAYYIFTPNDEKSCEAIAKLKDLLSETHATFITLTPEIHDEITGKLSHMPHIIASGIVLEADDLIKNHPNAKKLAAGGFRDITRIASSGPRMWTDILLSNRDVLLQQLSEWQNRMSLVQNWLEKEDDKKLYQFFNHGKIVRNELPIHKEGAIPAFYDLFVNVPDDYGVIAEVTRILANHKISIINIKILETREDIFGVLQLTFRHELDMNKARIAIEQGTTYQCLTQEGSK
ncbi:prephenate dehydrogenase [Vagococcus vulneris]|uniref:Prephenate dehydrogenase n=1 Tax=Vagococcus vulneris TaxID=1977869 RepID=A0A430A2N5_9ENTE|nr:prephenate dehydrogenase [Vagococcus vulneris]RSU00708.1 prephenate dehydrogenase [Vagococcus vulneris]